MNFIDKLDNFYNSRKSNEVWLMVILVSALIGYLIYTLLSPLASDYRKNQESINSKLTHKINTDKSYLKRITINGDRDFKVKQLDKQIAQKRQSLDGYRAKLRKLAIAMNKINGVLYTKDNWSKFLHNIASKAKDNKLMLDSITNVVLDGKNTKKAKAKKSDKSANTENVNSNFAKVLDIDIKCQGKYGNILAFMNDLEQTKLVANVSKVKLTATEGDPEADIKLSVWGIKP